MKTLSDDRLESFNTDYVKNHVGWERMENMIASSFQSGDFSFLDIGGGNLYPRSHALRGNAIFDAQRRMTKQHELGKRYWAVADTEFSIMQTSDLIS